MSRLVWSLPLFSTGSFLPELPVLGQLVTFMLLSKHHTFSEVKLQNNQISMYHFAWLNCQVSLLLRSNWKSYILFWDFWNDLDTVLCKSLVFQPLADALLHTASIILLQPWNMYSVHLPSSKKRNNNWIKPNKLIFLLSCHSLSQQKMKEHVPDGPSCGLGTGGFVRKIKIHFTFPSNK